MKVDDRIPCSTTDSIEVLSLSVRVFNALKRSDIKVISELMALSDEQLFAVRNLGEKGVAEIRERLARVILVDARLITGENGSAKIWSGEPQILIDLGPPTIPRHEVVACHQMMLARQIEAGLLHPLAPIDERSLSELVSTQVDCPEVYQPLLKILVAPVNVSQELERLLAGLPTRELDVLIARSGFAPLTLDCISSKIGLTRERVRQIEQKAIGRIWRAMSSLQPIRISSAFLYADDMDLSFDGWSRRLHRTGLLGDWSQAKFASIDQLECLTVLIRISSKTMNSIEIPESLKCMLTLRDMGCSEAPALMLKLLESYSGTTERLVMKHLRHSGAISLDWLVNQDGIEFSIEELRLILEYKSFFGVGENWFMSLQYAPNKLGYFSVLHRSLLKMFQYCGPLSLRDVYFGIERTLIKVDFPIPPLGVVEQILTIHGYASENDLWFWPGDASEELNSGESAIWATIHELGGVAHHSELMQAILDSGLSGASLHGTLRRSPLFDNFDQALYKLRGAHPQHKDIERAQSAANRTSVNLSVEHNSYGKITVGANLGILAIANGTIVTERLPNLEGVWQCSWGDGETSVIRVTHNEIRGLLGVMRFLDCKLGDRILLIFNVLDRTVAVRKIKANLND